MTEINTDYNHDEDSGFNWRSFAGYVYLTICVFDFIIMPVVLQVNKQETHEILLEIVEEHGIDKGLAVMDRMNRNNNWTPITLVGGGLFHISFGAILTGVAVTHGTSRRVTPTNNNRTT